MFKLVPNNGHLSPRRLVALILLISVFAAGMIGQTQDLPGTVFTNLEALPIGTYVIPMDNVRQGNAGGTTFNKRAYGLANALLQAGVPLKWAIKKGKAKDGEDFNVAANKIAGVGGGTASGSQSFSGGPFIVYPGYETQALAIITSFNNYITGTANDVVVYQTTAVATADIRYNLTHKPRIGVGSENASIHTQIFESAEIPGDSGSSAPPGVPDTYKIYVDTDIAQGTCVTLVTQPHTDSPAAINLIKAFVQDGGNFFAQCRAVNTYENVVPFGQFQTNLGYDIDNTNSTNILYPNPDMPMNQFVGAMNGASGGSERDWRLNIGSSFINSTFPIVSNNPDTALYIATVSKLHATGPGGMTFYLGSHEYDGSGLSDINAQRMLLNAVFQPPTRPVTCGINLGFPLVSGYKSVRMTNNVVPIQLSPGDEITWTIDYVNTGSLGVSNFQISDVLPNVPAGVVTYVAPPVVTFSGAGTSAAVNPSFTGVAPNQNLLAAGATLGVNGRITVAVKTIINLNNVTFENQTFASGTNIPTVASDNVDSTDTIITPAGTIAPPAGSIAQVHQPSIDPTAVGVFSPTAATTDVSGRVFTSGKTGLGRATVTMTDQDGNIRRTMTNSFGYYSFHEVEIGRTYVITVLSKQFQFSPRIITLNDELAEIDFIAF